jgi:hypothetical protein
MLVPESMRSHFKILEEINPASLSTVIKADHDLCFELWIFRNEILLKLKTTA